MTDLTKPKDDSWSSAITLEHLLCVQQSKTKVLKMENLCTAKKYTLETAGMQLFTLLLFKNHLGFAHI